MIRFESFGSIEYATGIICVTLVFFVLYGRSPMMRSIYVICLMLLGMLFYAPAFVLAGAGFCAGGIGAWLFKTARRIRKSDR